jgi:hypothetical protein
LGDGEIAADVEGCGDGAMRLVGVGVGLAVGDGDGEGAAVGEADGVAQTNGGSVA